MIDKRKSNRWTLGIVSVALFAAAAASAGAALAPSTDLLVAARAVQGAGAAIVTPLTLTLLAAVFPAERRGMAIGVWSGIGGSKPMLPMSFFAKRSFAVTNAASLTTYFGMFGSIVSEHATMTDGALGMLTGEAM